MFTADAFDAEEFVGFVADVGAKYFVSGGPADTRFRWEIEP